MGLTTGQISPFCSDNPLSPSVCDHSSDYPAYMLNENSTRTPYLFDSEDLCTKHASERLNFDITTPASTTTPSKCKWHMSAANFNYVCTNTDTVDETKINPLGAGRFCALRHHAHAADTCGSQVLGTRRSMWNASEISGLEKLHCFVSALLVAT